MMDIRDIRLGDRKDEPRFQDFAGSGEGFVDTEFLEVAAGRRQGCTMPSGFGLTASQPSPPYPWDLRSLQCEWRAP